MWLTRIERNQIYKAIEQSGLDPAECKLAVTDNKALITHDSGSIFEFASDSTDAKGDLIYSCKYIVIDGRNHNFNATGGFGHIINVITGWANEVKRTVEVPDLWTEAHRSRELITNLEQTDSANTPFTQNEQARIAA
jgi:hypothetical protein